MKRLIPMLYFFLTTLLAVLFAVFRTCMLLGGYDYENGFYTSNVYLRRALLRVRVYI